MKSIKSLMKTSKNFLIYQFKKYKFELKTHCYLYSFNDGIENIAKKQ